MNINSKIGLDYENIGLNSCSCKNQLPISIGVDVSSLPAT